MFKFVSIFLIGFNMKKTSIVLSFQFTICLFALVAVASAKPSIIAPVAYASPFGYPYATAYASPYVASPYVSPYSYAATYASPYYSGYPYAFFRRWECRFCEKTALMLPECDFWLINILFFIYDDLVAFTFLKYSPVRRTRSGKISKCRKLGFWKRNFERLKIVELSEPFLRVL